LPKGEPDPLELQVLSVDICHYTFPENMDLVIQAIGRLEPSPSFQGCGSTNDELTAWAGVHGLTPRRRWGDYDGGPFDPERSPRLIMLFEKEGG